MSEDKTAPTAVPSLSERMKAQQAQPGSPPSATSTAIPATPNLSSTQSSNVRSLEDAKKAKSEKATVRASHFVDDDGIAWTRTGLTLPAAFWRGIVAYTNQAKLSLVATRPRKK